MQHKQCLSAVVVIAIVAVGLVAMPALSEQAYEVVLYLNQKTKDNKVKKVLTASTRDMVDLTSTYVRIGSLGSFQKIGYTCLACNFHFDKKL